MTDERLFEFNESQTTYSNIFEDIKPAVVLKGGLYLIGYKAVFKSSRNGVLEARLVYNDGLLSTSYGGTEKIVIQGTTELSGYGQGLLTFQIRAIRGTAKALSVSFLVENSGVGVGNVSELNLAPVV